MAVAALVVGAAAVNVWWLLANRRGLPFDIDEAGYLTRALTDGNALRGGGLGALAAQVYGPDPQAPLLPVTAGFVHAATGVGPVGMFVTQQLFYAVLLVSAYSIARRLGGRVQALVATALIGACPGIVDGSRSFLFGLVAVAMVSAALAVQVWAGSFDRFPRAIAWGVVLGLAAGLRVSATGSRPRRLATLAAGLLVGVAVAWSWYSASWHSVVQYLTSYGYGAAARGYGTPRPPWSPGWWTARSVTLVDSGLLAPVALAVVGCLAVGVVVGVRRSVARREGRGGPEAEPGTRMHRVLAGLRGDRGTVVVVLAWSYLALSTTANSGSGFVFVLAPPLIVLSVSLASRSLVRHRRAWVTAMAMLGTVAAGSFAADSWPVATSGPVTLVLADWRVPVVDDQGTLRSIVTEGAPGEHLPTATVDAQLRAQLRAALALALLVERAERAGPGPPVVALATSDQFVNANSLGLDLLERTGAPAEVVLLHAPNGVGPSLAQQVCGTTAPEVVVVGPNSPALRVRTFLTVAHPLEAVPLLAAAGFHEVGTVRLPDGRVLQVWGRVPRAWPGHSCLKP